MSVVFQDTQRFFLMLQNHFGIVMYPATQTKSSCSFMGECYSMTGESFLINVVVRANKTDVVVYNVSGVKKVCVFQKSYSTVNDKCALSKSTSLFNFLQKVLYGRRVGA